MSKPRLQRQKLPPFHDLLPWADPYIATLIEKLQRDAGEQPDNAAERRRSPRCEAPPPLDVDPPDEDVYFGDNRPVRDLD